MQPRQFDRSGGALLVSLVVMLALFSYAGVSILGMLVSSSQGVLLANNGQRAHYLAESGGRYAIYRYASARAITSGSYLLAGGSEGFAITAVSNANLITFTSVGFLNPGTPLETRRRVTFDVGILSSSDGTLDLGFDKDGDMELDDTWTVDKGTVTIVSTGPSGNEPALLMKGEEAAVSLNWQGNPGLDLAAMWANAGETLSYGAQVKVKARSPGSSQGNHYMFGISFRLNSDATDCYGVSFFRSKPGSKQLPTWLTGLQGFDGIRDGNPHVVLWKQDAGVITLMHFRALTESDGVLVWDAGDNAWTVNPWSTLYLDLDEDFTGPGGTRINHISLFVQGPSAYPRDSAANWDESAFVPVAWFGITQPINDATYTSSGFDTIRPDEVGVHAFYDQPSSQQQFFDDFFMRVEGAGGTGGAIGSVVQY